ncbi:hypothetical protein PSI22_20870, partial [Xenorhabdus sp. XENO-7]
VWRPVYHDDRLIVKVGASSDKFDRPYNVSIALYSNGVVLDNIDVKNIKNVEDFEFKPKSDYLNKSIDIIINAEDAFGDISYETNNIKYMVRNLAPEDILGADLITKSHYAIWYPGGIHPRYTYNCLSFVWNNMDIRVRHHSNLDSLLNRNNSLWPATVSYSALYISNNEWNTGSFNEGGGGNYRHETTIERDCTRNSKGEYRMLVSILYAGIQYKYRAVDSHKYEGDGIGMTTLVPSNSSYEMKSNDYTQYEDVLVRTN